MDLSNNSMTELEVIASEIDDWLLSEERQNMIIGENYYTGNHDILGEARSAIGDDGQLIELENLPDNRIVDNQYAKMVDQKTNFLVGNPFNIDSKIDNYLEVLKKVMNYRFRRTFRNLTIDTLNCGIGWLHPYYDSNGEFKFKRFKPYEILPFWKDAEHTELDIVVRVYDLTMYEGTELVTKTKVEIYRKDRVDRYNLESVEFGVSVLTPDYDLQSTPYLVRTEGGEEREYSWGKIPMIPFKYNHMELPLITRVKSIQDAINRVMSNFVNNTLEDSRNTILVIHNYDGEDLGKFRRNLAQYGAIKVRSGEGANGKVETLQIDVNPENYKVILKELKKSLIENARGFDAKDDRMSGNPNQMNIESMYSDIDLDSNGMEVEFQASLEELMFFIDAHIANDFGIAPDKDVEFIFKRDMLMNENEKIDAFVKSFGKISDSTCVAHHPWVTDDEKELEAMNERLDEFDSYVRDLRTFNDEGNVDVNVEGN